MKFRFKETARFVLILFIVAGGPACASRTKGDPVVAEPMPRASAASSNQKGSVMAQTIGKTDEEWKRILTPEQYNVLRRKATEMAFTGRYYHEKATGAYLCAGCGNELFNSETKYESGSGWPSFWSPIGPGSIVTEEDNSHGMRRVEVLCARCGGHLGHVFDDGPAPTHLRYCINSVAMKFEKKP